MRAKKNSCLETDAVSVTLAPSTRANGKSIKCVRCPTARSIRLYFKAEEDNGDYSYEQKEAVLCTYLRSPEVLRILVLGRYLQMR